MRFFSLEDGGMGSSVFTQLIALLFLIIPFILIFKYKDRLSTHKKERTIAFSCTAFVVVLELIYHLQVILSVSTFREYLLGKTMLPLQMCALTLWLSVYAIIKKDERIFKFTFFTSILGGILSFIAPTLSLGPDHFRYYHFFIVHAGLILLNVYMYYVYRFRITKMDYLRASIVVVVVGALLIPFNFHLGTDYFYVYNYGGTPFEEFDSMIIVTILQIVLIFGFFGLVYLITSFLENKFSKK